MTRNPRSHDMPIRNLRSEDLDFALSLTSEEQWYYTRGEMERMLRLDPDGSFVYEEAEPLGFITCVTYGLTGVIGHLIVSKKGRGRRIGQALLKAGIAYMERRGANSMILYATQDGVRLYESQGFRILEEVACIHSTLDKQDPRIAKHPKCIPLLKQDLRDVAAIDAHIFGDERKALIELLYDEFPEHAFKVERNGKLSGYAFGRRTTTGFDFGPWVCTSGNLQDAEALFFTVLSTFGQGTLYLGIFQKNQAALDIARALPRVRSWRTFLMARGESRYSSDLAATFGIAAFELG